MKSTRQVKLTEKVKVFRGFAVQSEKTDTNEDSDLNTSSESSEEESSPFYTESMKKPRMMDNSVNEKGDLNSSGFQENSENGNISKYKTKKQNVIKDVDDDEDEDHEDDDEDGDDDDHRHLEKKENEISEYELLQQKNIEERNEFLKTLGIKNDIISPANEFNTNTQQKIKRSRPKEILPKREPSRRIRKLALRHEEDDVKFKDLPQERTPSRQSGRFSEFVKENVDDRLKGTIQLDLEEDEQSILNSFPILKENCTYDPNIDLQSCPLESFRSNLASLQMIGPHKVTLKRIQSLCVHPTTTKQIVLAGCVSGMLGLWDIKAGMENDVVEFSYHKAPLNCITVSKFNHCKIYTTSHEGSVCSVDIERKICSNIFSTDTSLRISHLTWHDEIDSNTLLVAHGDGSIGVLDLRESSNQISWINCFDRSCRTVQIHPVDKDYILASSGTVGCKIFDLRSCPKSICVADLPHPKGLTSAFFSPDGNNILTTCNDDRLRIFDSSTFQENLPKQKRAIVHNNRTGRWLSVFKATWFPYRSDLFFVGSLLSPRRIQIYNDTGTLIHELKHDDMVTISSLVAAHPKLPFVAGGNSSGRVHAFVPPDSGES